MEENKELLTQLDSAIGDGDLGLTMTTGFAAIVKFFEGDAVQISARLSCRRNGDECRSLHQGHSAVFGYSPMGDCPQQTELDEADLVVFNGTMHPGTGQGRGRDKTT